MTELVLKAAALGKFEQATPFSPFPRPRARLATGTATTSEGSSRTARPAHIVDHLAGGALHLPVRIGQRIVPAGEVAAARYRPAGVAAASREIPFPPPPTSGCAGTHPGGGGIQLTAGTAQAGRLGGRRPAVTLSLTSQS